MAREHGQVLLGLGAERAFVADDNGQAARAQHLTGAAQGQAKAVGLGRGFSVREVLDAVDAVVGTPLRRELAPRRAGDPPRLVADPSRIKTELGFSPRFTDLREIVQTAWDWHRSHPHGFGES